MRKYALCLTFAAGMACGGGENVVGPVQDVGDATPDAGHAQDVDDAFDGDPSAFTVTDDIDPHVLLLADGIREGGLDPLLWASENLYETDYVGALIAPRGVLAQYYGNRLDLCLLVHQLLSASEIPSRYRVWSDDNCAVEVESEAGTGRSVPLSAADDVQVPDDAATAHVLPASSSHIVEILERRHTVDGVEEASLGTSTTHALASGPLAFTYAAGSLTVQAAGEVWTGEPLTGAIRHDVVFRHTSPDGTTADHVRMLFDANSGIANPDADDGDRWVVWIGANAVTETFLRAETLVVGADATKEFEPAQDTTLWLRALELAMETDHALWQAFEPADDDDAATQGGAVFDQLRIVIAGREQHGPDGPTVPTFDLLANPRHLVGLADEVDTNAMMSAIGMLDALVETNVLANATGVQPMTLATVFAAMATELADTESRQAFFDDALDRLRDEGVTEEALVFWDPDSDARVEVVVVGAELVLRMDADLLEAFIEASETIGESLSVTRDGGALPEEGRGLVVEAALLWQGAALDFLPRLTHIESPQLALATPPGTSIIGTGTYANEGEAPHEFTVHAIARQFESPSGDEQDNADWHRVDGEGRIIGGGTVANQTARLDEVRPHLVQWGADDASSSWYDSPLWLGPAVVAAIRAGESVDLRIAYDVPDSVVDWREVTLSEFSTRRRTLLIDDEVVGVEVIDATDADGTHGVTIARHGLTRLVLEVETPVGMAGVTELRTSRAVRLRGRAVAGRGPQNRDGAYAVTLGVADTEVSVAGFGHSALSWPDGTIDTRVSGTEQPTLRGSTALLVDSSFSMAQPADADCDIDCASKMDVVLDALDQIAAAAPADAELALWKFEDYPGPLPEGACPVAMQVVSDWSLDPNEIADAPMRLTAKTPLSGAVRAALAAIDDDSWGAVRRLIVLADGDNDCSDSLDEITSLPSNLQIHTIGVGVAEGSDAEVQLRALAERTRGTYQRTTGGDQLLTALTRLATVPIDIGPEPTSLAAELRADEYRSLEVSFPTDSDDVTFTLERAPDAPPPAQVLPIEPDDTYPSELFDHSDEAIIRISEARARNPRLVVFAPDRMVAFGLISETLAWFEYDPATGAMVAVTLDSLHGASAVNTGALVAGLFSGVLGVISGFDDCVLGGLGCGATLDEIEASICPRANDGPFSIMVSYVTHPLSFYEGLNAGQFYSFGVALVEAACGGTTAVSSYLGNTATNVVQGVIAAGVGGGISGWLVSQVATNA